jgi:hypothetical protein
VLSPDADVLMTPNNIFNMAYLKKLDILAVTDHNSTKQLPICHEISRSYDMLFVPGIELSLVEDYHVLVYFETLQDALAFDTSLEPWRNQKRYDAMTEHSQGITDIDDQIVSYESYDLSSNLSLSLLDLKQLLTSFRHILVFAHIQRQKHSGLHVLPQPGVHACEIGSSKHINLMKEHHLETMKVLYSSDAHTITDINERVESNVIELDELTMDAFFRYFEHG